MSRDEILKAIEAYQPYIDLQIAGKGIEFKNYNAEIIALEKLWDTITGRHNTKFCRTCGGAAIREALIICANYQKRALKEIEAEKQAEESAKVEEKEVETPEVVEVPKPVKPKTNGRRKSK